MNHQEVFFPAIRTLMGGAILLAAWEFWRHRGTMRRDAFLLSLATLGILFRLTTNNDFPSQSVSFIGIISLGLHPYLLLKLLGRFHPVPRLVLRTALWVALYGIGIAVSPLFTTLPFGAHLFLGGYIVVIEFYALAFGLRYSYRQKGMIRWRFRSIAIGNALFALLVALLLADQFFTASWLPIIVILTVPLLVLGIEWGFHAGLHPPRWLRHAWAMIEIRSFIDKVLAPPARQRTGGVFDALLGSVEKAVEGVPLVALWEEQKQSFCLHTRPTQANLSGVQVSLAPPLNEVWLHSTATYMPTIRQDWHPQFIALQQEHNAQGLYLVPIATTNDVYGILIILLKSVPHFPSDDLSLLTYLCELSASVFEVDRLMEAQQGLLQNLHLYKQRAQRLNILVESIAHASLDTDAILITTTREMSKQMGNGCVISLLDSRREWLEAVSLSHPDPAKLELLQKHITGTRQRATEGISHIALTSRKPILHNRGDTKEVQRAVASQYRSLIQDLEIHSVMHVPLGSGEQPLGILLLFRSGQQLPFSYEDLLVVQTIADRVSLALENAALFKKVQDELEERSRTEKALRESESRFASILAMAPDAIISIDNYQRIVTFNRGAEKIFAYEAKAVLGQPLTLLFSANRAHQAEILRRLQDADTSHPTHHEGVLYWRRQHGDVFSGEVSISRLNLGGRLIRTLMLRDVTSRVAAEEQARRQTEVLSTLYDTTLALMDRLHSDDTLDTVLRRAAQLVQTEHGYIALLSDDQSEMTIQVTIGDFEKTMGYKVERGVGLIGKTWEQKELMTINNYREWPEHLEDLCTDNICATICVPLFADEHVVGLLGLAHTEPTRVFSEQEIEFLRLFAPLASIALYNAKLFAEVQRLATTDDLTGLHNRRAFFAIAETEFRYARTHKVSISVVMIDIDHFKKVNDTFGHTVGDDVIRWIAHECQPLLRAKDTLARYGGEEFALLLPSTTKEDAFNLAERIRHRIANYSMPISHHTVKVTLSLGVATITDKMDDVNDLLNLADRRLYGAKARGRNQVVAGVPTGLFISYSD